jgi:N-acetylneuraminate lyase
MKADEPGFRGLIAAPFTPFQADGSLDLAKIDVLADLLVADGARGAFICGTTGEGASMTTEERMRVAYRWTTVARERLRVYVHVGHTSAADARTLAAHAQRIEADAIGCLAPYFFKPRSCDELADYCGYVAAAAPGLPFYYYHLPSLTGVSFTMRDFLPVAASRIPTLAGIKFTYEDVVDFTACTRFDGGRFEMLFGRDELLLEGLAAGASGAIGSTYNFMAPVYTRLIESWAAGDLATAKSLQSQATRVIDVMNRHGGLPAGKRIMKLARLDCGPVRLPLIDLDSVAAERLRVDLLAVGFNCRSPMRRMPAPTHL